jgi:hypothetical protein
MIEASSGWRRLLERRLPKRDMGQAVEASGSTDAEPDAWPGFDRYVARLRDEAKAPPSR